MRADLKRLKRDTESGRSRTVSPVRSAGQTQIKSTRMQRAVRSTLVILAIGLAVAATYLLTRPVPMPKVTGYSRTTNDGREKVFSGIWAYLLTDGPRIYIQELIDGRFGIAVVSATGGEAMPMQTPFENVRPGNISPDKSQLVVASFVGYEAAGPLWTLPVLGGSPRRLGDLTGGDATWSSNGELLVSRGADLYLAKANGSAPRKLVSLGGHASWLRWSPDGRTLRFTLSDPNPA